MPDLAWPGVITYPAVRRACPRLSCRLYQPLKALDQHEQFERLSAGAAVRSSSEVLSRWERQSLLGRSLLRWRRKRVSTHSVLHFNQSFEGGKYSQTNAATASIQRRCGRNSTGAYTSYWTGFRYYWMKQMQGNRYECPLPSCFRGHGACNSSYKSKVGPCVPPDRMQWSPDLTVAPI